MKVADHDQYMTVTTFAEYNAGSKGMPGKGNDELIRMIRTLAILQMSRFAQAWHDERTLYSRGSMPMHSSFSVGHSNSWPPSSYPLLTDSTPQSPPGAPTWKQPSRPWWKNCQLPPIRRND